MRERPWWTGLAKLVLRFEPTQWTFSSEMSKGIDVSFGTICRQSQLFRGEGALCKMSAAIMR